jgi:hypothetical protein
VRRSSVRLIDDAPIIDVHRLFTKQQKGGVVSDSTSGEKKNYFVYPRSQMHSYFDRFIPKPILFTFR